MFASTRPPCGIRHSLHYYNSYLPQSAPGLQRWSIVAARLLWQGSPVPPLDERTRSIRLSSAILQRNIVMPAHALIGPRRRAARRAHVFGLLRLLVGFNVNRAISLATGLTGNLLRLWRHRSRIEEVGCFAAICLGDPRRCFAHFARDERTEAG